MDDLVAKALHAARRHFENGGDAPVIPPEFTSDTAGTPVDFRPLNFDALRQANAVRVTNRANPDGTTDTDPNAGFSIVSGWNDSMAQHGDPRSTVTWPDNPEAYGTVADMFANNPEWITPHKYRQILHSARELGMRDEDVYAQPRAHGGSVDAALHAVRHHLAGGGFLSDLFSGPDYQSTGEVASPTNWGDPDSAADFFRADKALRLAREVQANEEPALTALRPGAVETRELPPPSAPIAYGPEPEKNPARVAIDEATKLTGRAPQEMTGADSVWTRMLKQESGNRQFDKYGRTVTSSKGALGISQVMPSTGPEAAGYAGLPWDLNRLRTDPEYNHALGRAYYDAQLARFGDPVLAAAAYNGGPGRVAGALRQAQATGRPWTDFLKPETQNYVRVVGRAEGGKVDAPDEVNQALDVVRREPMTPASLARAWTPPEETIATNLSPRASEFMQQYPEKLAAGIAAAPEAVAHAVTDPFMLARQAYEGQLPPDYFHSDEGIGRAFNAAGLPMTGGVGGVSAKAGETVLGSGPVRKALEVVAQQPRELSPLGFYSHGAETAGGLQQAKGTPQQYYSMLEKGGVKPAELEGFNEAFASKPSVTREEIAAHFKARMPQVEETVLRDRKFRDVNEAQAAVDAALERGDPAAAELLHRDWEAQFQGTTKFGQYTLPGGENYREVLLKEPIPTKKIETEGWTAVKDPDGYARDYLIYDKDGKLVAQRAADSPEQAIQSATKDLNTGKEITSEPPKFQSSHWDDPNVLAHLRMADRTGPNGEKILHVEEIQSDWGQKGKKEGFDVGITPQQEKRMQDLTARVADLSTAERGELGDLLRASGKGGVPSAPYVTNTQAWTDLALKRALKEAAEGGYDKLVWTPGAEQAKRYDLSRHVDNITWSAEPDGKYWVGATKDGRPVRGLENEPMDAKKLEATFGKEIAEKIVKGEGKKMVGGPEMELTGLDLQTGGEGMKGYYDKIVPNQLSKLVKKLDPEAKIGRETLETRAMTPEQLMNERTIPDQNQVDFHSLTITPKMRESILRGQTAFKDGGSVVDRALMLVSRQA